MDNDCAVLAHSNICIMRLHPTRGTDYSHVFIVEEAAASEVNYCCRPKSLSSQTRGEKVDKTVIWLATCSSVLCILTTNKTLLYTIMIQSATCFDSLAVTIRLISKTHMEVYIFCIVHCNIIIWYVLPTRLLKLMYVKHTISYLNIQPSSWRWTLRFKACRRCQKLKILGY